MTQLKPGTIAIVDDDSSVREGLRRFVEATGLQVKSFASAAAFLSSTPESFARLILDQHVPETTGFDKPRPAATIVQAVSGELSRGSETAASR